MYSFNAEILLSNAKKYQLESKGFWESKIELKDGEKILLEFKMGWKGIIINSFLEGKQETFLLKIKGLLSSKFMLIDTNNNELMAAETDFKWNKLTYDYLIETVPLLTMLHCINYYMSIATSGGYND